MPCGEIIVPPKPIPSATSLHEEYYQVSPAILESFPRFRLPLDTYIFNEQIVRLVHFSKAEQRISPEFREEIIAKSAQGLIFVSRQDHPVYIKHISKQLDLVLLDTNLRVSEIASIFQQALTERMEEFLLQPVAMVLEKLRTDVLVLTEYLWQDNYRIKGIAKRIWPEHSLAKHSVNVGFLGLALFMHRNEGKLNRKSLDETALGLFLHDVGMSKVPSFILQKTKPLSRDDQAKISAHCSNGVKLLQNLGVHCEPVLKQTLEHQERLDGKGYPQRILRNQVSSWGQLCAVVDSYCAMTSTRIHAPAKPSAQALNELLQDPGYNQKLVRSLQTLILTKL
jgi:HD-GYP domain-containing protein (c-di-GMP phosphodiesterase class II)